jgi:hypothetical protein
MTSRSKKFRRKMKINTILKTAHLDRPWIISKRIESQDHDSQVWQIFKFKEDLSTIVQVPLWKKDLMSKM